MREQKSPVTKGKLEATFAQLDRLSSVMDGDDVTDAQCRCGGHTSSQAAIVIGQEAGCYVTGEHDSPRDGNVTPDTMLGRKYFTVRAIADSEVRPGPQMSVIASDSKVDGERNRYPDTYRRRVLRHCYGQNPRLDGRRSALHGHTPGETCHKCHASAEYC